MSSASRGLAPRKGLESLLVKMGRTGPLAEPCRGPQAGKSGDPRSQTPTVAPGPRRAQTWLRGEAKGQVRSAAGPNSLRPWLTRGD